MVDSDQQEDPEADLSAEAAESSSSEKNPIIAALLSFVFPGLGHLYGQGVQTRGLLFLVVGFISYVLIFFGIGLFTSPVVVLAAVVDSYLQTQKQ